MNTTSTQAGIIHSLGITVVVIVLVLMASKGEKAVITIPITALFNILLFSYMGWFPSWTGSVIALVLVVFLGLIFTGGVGGKD